MAEPIEFKALDSVLETRKPATPPTAKSPEYGLGRLSSAIPPDTDSAIVTYPATRTSGDSTSFERIQRQPSRAARKGSTHAVSPKT